MGHLENLRILDLSFNQIKKIENLQNLKKLEKLFLTQNKISEIEGLESLTELRVLELGSNKIREFGGIENLKKLEEIWLGKNKINNLNYFKNSEIKFKNLKIISLQSNRLTEWDTSFLESIPNVENLYLGSNQLPDPSPEILSSINPRLIELDISYNALTDIPDHRFEELEELWLNNNKIEKIDNFNKLANNVPKLKTLYLEKNPVQTTCPLEYKNELIKNAPPGLEQIDSFMFLKGQIGVSTDPEKNPVSKTILKQQK